MKTIPIRTDINLTNELIRQNRVLQERGINAQIAFHLTRVAVRDARGHCLAVNAQAARCLSNFLAFASSATA